MDTKQPMPPITHTAETLNKLTKEELCSLVLQQQDELTRKSLKRELPADSSQQEPQKKFKSKSTQAPIDWKKYSIRQIALKIAYLGWDYCGLAAQSYDDTQTIEGELFSALKRTRLVPEDADWKSVNYSRSGRTDKGVSAFGQVVSLQVRSHTTTGEGIISVGQSTPEKGDIDYVAVLNRALPGQIRALGWTPVPADFSARRSTKMRRYHYIFDDSSKSLDINKMKEAGKLLIGEHDFRNFCKYDPAGLHWTRRIVDVDILPFDSHLKEGQTSNVYYLSISGTAFLWHQIRCISYILFLIGKGLEKIELITDLLDLKKYPTKPIYDIASDIPLILVDSQQLFSFSSGEMIAECEELISLDQKERIAETFREIWESYQIKTSVASSMLKHLQRITVDENPNKKPRTPQILSHIPLAQLRGKYLPFANRKRREYEILVVFPSHVEEAYEEREKKERKLTENTGSEDDMEI